MSEPFLAEIRIVGFNFPPRGWAFCDGQILPINQNQSLFSLLGTTYGGDGRTSFALPDLRGRTPVHETSGFGLGSKGGSETHTLTVSQVPGHEHQLRGSSANGDSPVPTGNAIGAFNNAFNAGSNLTALQSETVGDVGGQGHENMQPFMTLNFCIAIQGLFPSRN